jgi:hypothetical protein
LNWAQKEKKKEKEEETMEQSAKASYERIQQLLESQGEDIDQYHHLPIVAATRESTFDISTKDIEVFIFHDRLQLFVDKYGLMQAPSLAEFSDLTTEYSVQIDSLRRKAKDFQQLILSANRSNIEEQERRTERDFWSLLQVMSISDVLGVVEDTRCQQVLEESLSELSPLVTIPDYLNTAFASDLRFKKAKVIKDWLENSYRDQVVDIPVPRSPPMFETCMAIQQKKNHGDSKMDIVRGRSQLTNIYPDCQLHPAGLLTLVGSDQQDQEAMLLCIWQLIRSGQIDEAQRKAYEHQAFWLASSLRGVDPHWYSTRESQRPENDDDAHRMDGNNDGSISLVRRGNVRPGLCVKNAYQYAGNLLQSLRKSARDVSIASYATVLEMSIYAVLSNHMEALKESQLISTWSDKLWVHVNGVYNRDLVNIYQLYYERKSQHSRLYPGCDDKTIETNMWLKNEFSRIAQGNIDDNIGQAVPAPPTRNLECILRQLQIAFLGGVKSIRNYFDANLLELIEPKDTYPGYEHVLRVIVHILLWCGLSPSSLSAPLDQVVGQEMYYHTLEIYINHLIGHAHYELVALYARFLSPHRRVVAYATLLIAIQSDHVNPSGNRAIPLSRSERDVLSRKALALAQQYFPDDMADITRTVMEDSSKSTSLLQHHPHAPSSQATKATPATTTNTKHFLLSPPPRTGATPSNTASASQALVVVPSIANNSGGDEHLALVNGSSSVPSETDRLVLESLRWVVLESSQQEQHDISKAVEVLRAVHRVVGNLLLDSNMEKLSLLPQIVDNYATEEILLCVDQHIEHLKVQQRLQKESDSQKTALYEQQWKVDKNIYSLWQVLRMVYQRREDWLDCLRFIRIEQDRSMGQMDEMGRLIAGTPPMELYHHLRNLVLDELLPLIESIFETDAVNDHGIQAEQQGLVTVMQDAINSARAVSSTLLQEVVSILSGVLEVPDGLSSSALSLRDQTLLSAQRARDDEHLLRKVQQLFTELNNHAEDLKIQSEEFYEFYSSSLNHIEQSLQTTSSLSSEALLRIYKLLQVVAVRMKDTIETQKLLSLLVYYLLQLYLSICLRSNEALSLFEGLRDTGVAETHTQILVCAFQLSNMIAHEGPTLGLYRLLTT